MIYNKTIKLLALLLITSTGYLSAQTKLWQKGVIVDEFVYEKAPFPQSHSATIVETPAGLVTAFFGGTKERNPDVCIWVSRHVNGKWTAPDSVADGVMPDKRYPTWNPVLYQIPGGELMLFYKIGASPGTWKGWLRTSKDNGITWSEARALPEGYLGPVKNKPVLLSNGNLFCPTSTEGNKEGNSWQIHFEVTPDFGKTWRKIGPLTAPKGFDAIQPSILDHGNGKLQILARSRSRAILESWSYDNGETWWPLSKTTLPNNNSGTDAVTMQDGRHALVYNHVLPPGDLAKGPRTPLNLSISKDGKKWRAAAILEDSPISQYSYPSIIQTKDGMLHAVYTWRRERIKHAVIDPSKVRLKKIKKGVWPKLKGYTAPGGSEITND
ncbi:exo-alpha-sialidase [Pedobacter sp. SYSU D00535]|uniref:sialidase family protein n=1 Tax=Pedobacter sp. SYSU D00535 TaxID=2810308 RepID=UPI001A965816|nr:sialidase family protein [Pedobacter sp. SYSU D00535]